MILVKRCLDCSRELEKDWKFKLCSFCNENWFGGYEF